MMRCRRRPHRRHPGGPTAGDRRLRGRAHLRRPTLRAGVHPYWPAGRHPPVQGVHTGASRSVPNLHPAQFDPAFRPPAASAWRILPAVAGDGGGLCRLRLSVHRNGDGRSSAGVPRCDRCLRRLRLSSRQRDQHGHLLQRQAGREGAAQAPSPSCSSDASVTARRARFQSTQRSASRKGRPRRRQWARMDSIQGRVG